MCNPWKHKDPFGVVFVFQPTKSHLLHCDTVLGRQNYVPASVWAVDKAVTPLSSKVLMSSAEKSARRHLVVFGIVGFTFEI